jgi:hypothetical protein
MRARTSPRRILGEIEMRRSRDLPVPSTGSLRTDLLEFGELVLTKLTSTHGNALLKASSLPPMLAPGVREKVGKSGESCLMWTEVGMTFVHPPIVRFGSATPRVATRSQSRAASSSSPCGGSGKRV